MDLAILLDKNPTLTQTETMIRLLTVLLLTPSLLFAQERKDDPPPHIKNLASLPALIGWTKNDLGKWSSAPNALPRYVHDYYFPICEHILKIDLAEVQYKDKTMLCLAKFLESKYVKYGKIHIEYPIDYWIFDLSSTDTIIGQIPSVQAVTYHTIASGFFSGIAVATWRDISNDIIVHFESPIGLEGDLCIQSREDKKNNKIQLLVGSYNRDIHHFDFNYCTMPGDDNELENGYYELPTNTFSAFIKKIHL